MKKSKNKKPSDTTEQCAVYMWDSSGLNIAIPKRKGTGYLSCPLGHHFVAALNHIETDEGIELCGIDGYLNLEYGYIYPESRQKEIVDRVMPRLAKHYKFKTWEEDTNKFWQIVQIRSH